MAVRVRMFAALRDAAGTDEVVVEPAPLPDLLDELRARFDEPFTRRLAVCTVLVDGTATPAGTEVVVPDGAEVALLPPVSGGSRRHARRRCPAHPGASPVVRRPALDCPHG